VLDGSHYRISLCRIILPVILVCLGLCYSVGVVESPLPTLGLGDEGEYVVLLEQALSRLRVYNGEPRGVFDTALQQALLQFQERAYLPATGRTDALTWRNLGEAVNDYPLVIGYYVSGGAFESYSVLEKYGHLMTAIAPVWFWIESDGRVLGNIDMATMESARRRGVRLLALVNNLRYDTATSKAQVERALHDETVGRAIIRNIVLLAEKFGFTGINLDFEYIRPEDRERFSVFVGLLGQELRARKLWFTVSVAAKTADRDAAYGFNGGFDYKALSKAADHLIIMAYDYHYAGGPPGPVAPINWIENVIRYAKTQVKATQLILGVNAYGYDWYSPNEKARAVVMRNVPAWLASKGISLAWDPVASAPYVRYRGSSGEELEAWLENAQSIKQKMTLVKTHGLAGLAWWRMGYEDDSFWEALQSIWPYPEGWSTYTPIRTAN
jgi:spore germination protein